MLQPHIRLAMEPKTYSSRRQAVYDLSNNAIPPNKKMKTKATPARYGSTHGLPGPKADFAAPIVAPAPRAVMDVRQLFVNGRNNEIPDEYGVKSAHTLPMQNITPTSGGKHSGRTGPIR